MYAGGCTYLCSQPSTEQAAQTRRCGENNTLFGPHAKFALQHSPPAVANEAELMKSMRTRLGPYASETALLYHLRAARGKVFWAVNTYFRAVLAEQVKQADFEPRQYAQLANCQVPATPECPPDTLSMARPPILEQQEIDDIPVSIIEHVLQHTDLFTVCSAALASRSLRQAVESNLVWEVLYTKRWASTPLCQQPPDCYKLTDQPFEPSTWHEKYHKRHSAEQRMQCPVCMQSKVVPIVYGFPSHLLVRSMRANKLRMGNDHLIEGQPIWTCTACAYQFDAFPFSSLELA